MNRSTELDYLVSREGVVAAMVAAQQEDTSFRGDQKWEEILQAAYRVHQEGGEDKLHFLMGAHSIFTQKQGGETILVVCQTGHGVVKSLRRTIKRLERRMNSTPQHTTAPELHPPL